MYKLLFLLILSILFFPTVALSGQTSISSSGYYCSSDSFSSGNNNYTCSAGTIFPSGSGELCTYEQTPCNQSTSAPQCPSGYSWNGTTCTEQVTTTQTVMTNPQFNGGSGGDGNGIYGIDIQGNGLYRYDGQYDGCGGAQWNSYTASFSGFSMSGSIGWFCTYPTLIGEGNTIQGVQINSSCASYAQKCVSGYSECTRYCGRISCCSGDTKYVCTKTQTYCSSYNYSESSVGSISVSGASVSGTTTLGSGIATGGNQFWGDENRILNSPANNSCPTGFYYSSGACYENGGGALTFSGVPTTSTTTTTQTTSATCPSGTTLVNNECVSYSCPLGGSTQCIEPSGSSTYYCSPDTCQYLTYNNGTISISGSTTTSGSLPQAPPNNGTVTSAGCQGSIYIFSGTAVSCRSGGLQTAYHDCCNAGTYLFGAVQCNSTEKVTAQSLTYDQQYGNSVYPNANYTGGLEGEDIYVGSYCSDSFLGMCLETMDVFCQFPGLLASTIQQQGRAQLGIGWGSAQSPDCSGFTPNQFQELNFGNMNLSNYTNVLEQTTINGLSGTVNGNISNIENSITNEINQSMSGQ